MSLHCFRWGLCALKVEEGPWAQACRHLWKLEKAAAGPACSLRKEPALPLPGCKCDLLRWNRVSLWVSFKPTSLWRSVVTATGTWCSAQSWPGAERSWSERCPWGRRSPGARFPCDVGSRVSVTSSLRGVLAPPRLRPRVACDPRDGQVVGVG